jgi:hypothetical protein
MKLEPNNPLNLGIKNAKRLRFDKLSVIQLYLILTIVIAKLVTSIEAVITCLGIPIIQKSEVVIYIDSKPLEFQTKIVS